MLLRRNFFAYPSIFLKHFLKEPLRSRSPLTTLKERKTGKKKENDPYGNRTHHSAVKGRCLNRLTNGPYMRVTYHLMYFNILCESCQDFFTKYFEYFVNIANVLKTS